MADVKITDLPEVTEVADDDQVLLIDVSDNTAGPNGTDKRSVLARLADLLFKYDVETAAELEASNPIITGRRAICRERAHANYILADEGYTALPGDIVAANGRVLTLLKHGAYWLAESFASLDDALSRASRGETVTFETPVTRTSDLVVPQGVTLQGLYQSAGELREDWDYTQSPSTIKLDDTSSISLGENACIKNCLVVNSNLDGTPYANETEALAGIAAFAGTAITINGADAHAENLLILGFEYAVYSYNFERVTCHKVKGDCTNGIHIERCFDVSYITECHFWPFITVHQIGAGLPISTYTRSGTAYKYSEVADWCKITDSFSYGYYRGVQVLNANNVVATGVGCDNITIAETEETIGFLISGSSRGTKLIGCQTANQEHGYYINTTAGYVTTLMGCDSWVTETSSIVVAAGNVTVNGGAHRNGASGVYVSNADSVVLVDGVSFDTFTQPPINPVVPNSNIIVGKNIYKGVADGVSPVSSNVAMKSVTSAAPLSIPANGEIFSITGTVSFGTIQGGYNGRQITLKFNDVLTIGDGGNINLSSDFTTSAGDTLSLSYVDGQWVETSRSVN